MIPERLSLDNERKNDKHKYPKWLSLLFIAAISLAISSTLSGSVPTIGAYYPKVEEINNPNLQFTSTVPCQGYENRSAITIQRPDNPEVYFIPLPHVEGRITKQNQQLVNLVTIEQNKQLRDLQDGEYDPREYYAGYEQKYIGALRQFITWDSEQNNPITSGTAILVAGGWKSIDGKIVPVEVWLTTSHFITREPDDEKRINSLKAGNLESVSFTTINYQGLPDSSNIRTGYVIDCQTIETVIPSTAEFPSGTLVSIALDDHIGIVSEDGQKLQWKKNPDATIAFSQEQMPYPPDNLGGPCNLNDSIRGIGFPTTTISIDELTRPPFKIITEGPYQTAGIRSLNILYISSNGLASSGMSGTPLSDKDQRICAILEIAQTKDDNPKVGFVPLPKNSALIEIIQEFYQKSWSQLH